MTRALAATSILALAAVGLAACQPRAAPYRFRGPLVGSVAAAELDSRPVRRAGQPAPSMDPLVDGAEPVALAPPEDAGAGLAGELRGLVGVRDARSSHVRFALDVVAHLGVTLDGELRGAERGRELLAIARARGATGEGRPLLGDLVVFDDVRDGEPASLVGVVVAVDGAGTVELIHLSRGVVRRGYLNRQRPGATRDDDGRALNTFIRAGLPGDPPDTRYLTGELFSTFIHLDRLAD
jgi:hypothetical protein